MDFRILGPVEAFSEGRPLPLRGQRQRALLAYLLLHAGQVVGDRILTSGSGYSIRVERGELDLARYRSELAEAAATADPAERSRRLRAADALWRGATLDG